MIKPFTPLRSSFRDRPRPLGGRAAHLATPLNPRACLLTMSFELLYGLAIHAGTVRSLVRLCKLWSRLRQCVAICLCNGL